MRRWRSAESFLLDTSDTCGEPRPPYQFYCDRHLEDGQKNDKPLLIDRITRRMFGRS